MFFAGGRAFLDLDSVPIHEQNVFVELRVTVIPSDFAGLDELVGPFQDRLVRQERENGAAPIADRVQITGWFKGFDIHLARNVTGNPP